MQHSKFATISSLIIGVAVAALGCNSPTTRSDRGGGGGDTESGGDSAGGTGNGGNGGLSGSGGSNGSRGGSGGTNRGGSSGSNAGGSGGTPAVGGTNQGGSAGTPSTQALFSDDFEAAVIGQRPPSPWVGSGGVVDGTKSYSGGKSIKFVSDGPESSMTAVTKQIIKGPGKTVFVRFMVWMNNFPSAGDNSGHWDIVRHVGTIAGGDLSINGFMSIGGFDDDSLKMQFFGDAAEGKGREDCTKIDALIIRPKQWNCIEWKIDETDFLTYGLDIDGLAVPSFTFNWEGTNSICSQQYNITRNNWFVPDVFTTKFGWMYYPPQSQPQNVTLWIDDVVIDSKAIGCPAQGVR